MILKLNIKFTFLIILITFQSLSYSQSSKKLDPIDIFDLEYVSNPKISPKGDMILYQRNFKDIMTDKSLSNIWLVNFDGSNNTATTNALIFTGENEFIDFRGKEVAFIFVVGMQAFVGNGLSFSGKALGFKFEKLNLIKGLGRIFSIKGLVELIKSVAKVVLLTSCVVIFLWYFLPDIIYLSAGSLENGLGVLYKTLLLFIFCLIFILFAIGLGDYIWSRHTFLQKLRMTKQDIKEEFKESEGSPEVKARMRRMQMEASQRAAEQSQAIDDVKDATVVITNPTHFAVAIKYDPATDTAPVILAMGKDIMAKRVIEQAELHSKSIIRSPILARALYFTGNIGQAISEQLYAAVASILAYVYQLERGIEATLQEPEVPEDFIFDENGRSI